MQQTEKKARPLAWIAVTGILVIILIASVLTGGFGITGAAIAGTDANMAANKALDFINTIQPGTKAYLNGVGQSNGLYTMNFTVDGQKYMAYISPDGKMLFPSVIDISEPVTAPTQSANTGFNPAKTTKPTIQMFVMSFCPYGKQAEQGMGPAIVALGSNVNFEPHFIVTMSGDTINSLHGANEAAEDERQAVIWKYWPDKFWPYVNYVNANATVNTISATWKDAAKAAGLGATQIEAKVASDGLTLMKAEAALAQSLGVSSSPTVLVNGESYDGDRSAEAFKTAFCSAFTTEPAVCNQALSSEAGTAAGGCTTP